MSDAPKQQNTQAGIDGPDPKLLEAMNKTPYLADYVNGFVRKGKPYPKYFDKIDGSMKNLKVLNMLYPISEQNFIHLNSLTDSGDGYYEYIIIGPPEPDARL